MKTETETTKILEAIRRADQLMQLDFIEERTALPTFEEWSGILHEIACDEDAPMERRIRALAQMDRVTGEPCDLTEKALREYVHDTQAPERRTRDDLRAAVDMIEAKNTPEFDALLRRIRGDLDAGDAQRERAMNLAPAHAYQIGYPNV